MDVQSFVRLQGALFTILVNEDSTQMMSGGRDGTIHVWDISTPPNFNKLITYKVSPFHNI